MEADATMKMVGDAFLYSCFIFDLIVGDNDSTMRALLNHPSLGS